MPKFRFAMFEKRLYRAEYVVEAETLEEAKDKAAEGDTVEETSYNFLEVTERSIIEED